MPQIPVWHEHFLAMAFVVSKLSKDPSTQVGAIIASPDKRQISMGYNGFPAGMIETPKKWERPEKYERVIHAEMNAVLNARFLLEGATVYCTLAPCHKCMAGLLQAGVKHVVYYDNYPRQEHQELWEELRDMFKTFIQFPATPYLEQQKTLTS